VDLREPGVEQVPESRLGRLWDGVVGADEQVTDRDDAEQATVLDDREVTNAVLNAAGPNPGASCGGRW
jgi:hypothetical protein